MQGGGERMNYIKDKELSLKAKGLLFYMQSVDKIIIGDLYLVSKDGAKSVDSGVRELKHKGYLLHDKTQDATGKFKHDYKLNI